MTIVTTERALRSMESVQAELNEQVTALMFALEAKDLELANAELVVEFQQTHPGTPLAAGQKLSPRQLQEQQHIGLASQNASEGCTHLAVVTSCPPSPRTAAPLEGACCVASESCCDEVTVDELLDCQAAQLSAEV